MSEAKRSVDTDPDNYSDTVKPVQRRRTRGEVYETAFRYTQVYMDFDPETVFVEDAETRQTERAVFYKYGDKDPIMVTEEGAHAHEDSITRDAQEQAFFVLSQLAEHGNVGSWGKVR